MVDICLWAVLAALIAAFLFAVLMLVKNEITFKNLCLILDAVCLYNLDCIRNGNKADIVSYDNIKSYDEVYNNLFDWGYKNILPPDDFEKVKPFIYEVKHNERT